MGPGAGRRPGLFYYLEMGFWESARRDQIGESRAEICSLAK